MTILRCAINHRHDVADGWTVCRGCLDRLDVNLRDIVELVRQAAGRVTELTRQMDGGSGTEDPLPIPADMFDVAQGMEALGLLESWERMTREFYGLSPYGPASLRRNAAHRPRNAAVRAEPATVVALVTCVGFMRSQLARIAESADYPIEELAREVREQVVRYSWVDPARCNADNGLRLKCPGEHPDADGRPCHARIVWDRDRPNDDIHCPRCRSVWNGPHLLLLALHDDTQALWFYPADIERIIGIPRRTLQRWGKDELIPRRGSEYDMGAAFRLRMRVGA